MKSMQIQLYEKGDYVQVTNGFNKGRVGIVYSNQLYDKNVIYRFIDKDYVQDDDDWEDEDDYNSESSPAKFLRFLTQAEYKKALVDSKILLVEGLPVSIQFKAKNLLIGDNVITPANAKKIADFILDNTKVAKKRK